MTARKIVQHYISWHANHKVSHFKHWDGNRPVRFYYNPEQMKLIYCDSRYSKTILN